MTNCNEQRIWTIVGRLERRLPRDGEIFAVSYFGKAMMPGDDACVALWSLASSRLRLSHNIAKPSHFHGNRVVA